MMRRLLILVALAILGVAAAAGAFSAAFSSASFTTNSSTTVQASTAQLSGDGLHVSGGNGQSAAVGTAVAIAPSVLVTDSGNNPVSGVLVTFDVVSGGGFVSGASATTDAFGIAAVGSWTLGTRAGANGLSATATGLSAAPVTFTAIGVGGAADASRSTLSPASASVTADGTSTQVLTVQAKDAGGDYLTSGGSTVTISRSSGSGSVGAVTDHGNGTYSATVTAPTASGSGVFVATLDGSAVMSGSGSQTQAIVTFVAGPTIRFAVSIADAQANGAAFTGVNTVTAQDANGNTVTTYSALTNSVTISASPSTGTITGLGSASGSVLNQTLDFVDGVASLTGKMVFAGPAGNYTFTATSSSGGYTGTSRSVAIAVGAGSKLAIITQPVGGASAALLTTAPVVKVEDVAGNMVTTSNALITVTSSGTSTIGGSQATGLAAINGVATFTNLTLAGTVSTSYTLTFASSGLTSVTSTSVQVTVGAAGKLAIITQPVGGASGSVLVTQPVVEIEDSAGNRTASTASISVTSSAGSAIGGSQATGKAAAGGRTSFTNLTLGGTVGTDYTLTFASSGLTSVTSDNVRVTVGGASKYVVTSSSYYPKISTGVTISAQLTDAYGNPVGTSGLSVTWSKTGSGGTLPSSTSTNASGLATGTFTTGTTAGTAYTVTATSTIPSTRTGTSAAIKVVGPASKIALNAGSGQSATVGTAVTADPSVLVTDSFNSPVSGVAVTFAVYSGGGSVSGGSATTNASGIATVGRWTLGTTSGANTLRASSGTLSGSPVTITATGIAGAATQLGIETAADGSGTAIDVKAVTAGSSFTGYAITRDTYNNFAGNVAATWSLSGKTGGVVDGDLVAAGNGQSAVFSGHIVGTASVQAVCGTLSDSSGLVTVNIGPASKLALNAGDGQSATVGTSPATAPSVLVTDAGGNLISGVAVTFAVYSGGGSVSGGSATTNASGIATVGSWTLGTTAGANTLRASSGTLSGSPVTIAATGIAGAATKYLVTAGSSSPVAGADVTISAQLVDHYGNAVSTSGVAVAWSKTGSGGTLPAGSATDSNGIATVAFTTSTTAGRTYTVTATDGSSRTGASTAFTTTAGPVGKITANAGGGQAATVGTAVATDPSVLVTDANDNPVSGVTLTFAVASGGGSVSGGSATTNASGIATVGSWTLGTAVGSNSLTATAAGLSISAVTFTANGTVGAASQYIVTASSYSPMHGTAVTITAQLADQYGNPVSTSGTTVIWSKTGSGGSFSPTSSRTDSNGVATTTFTTGNSAGRTYTTTATSGSTTGTSAGIVTK